MFRNTASDVLTFQVTVTDPCVAATISDHALTAQSVVNGATKTLVFDQATDSVDAAQPVKDYCGKRTYVVMDGNTGAASAVSWISIVQDTP